MESRRSFLQKSLMMAAALSVPSFTQCIDIRTIRSGVPMKTRQVNKALVLWYSQTGYTERDGKLLAKSLEKKGVTVTSSDIRGFQKNGVVDYDLIVIGSPVFNYDTPEYVKKWIRKSMSDIKGTPVAAFVTFGGPEGNQHNAACSILEELTKKNGVPIGIKAFMNMSSHPLTWSKEKIDEKTWMNRHLPDEETYKKVRVYAGYLVDQVEQGRSHPVTKKLTLREIAISFGPVWWTKLFVKNHSIIKEKCIGCGLCVEKCPVDAIDLDAYKVDTESCVLCFGCINNCPAQAVHMESGGESVIGYNAFMKLKHLEINEPEELKV